MKRKIIGGIFGLLSFFAVSINADFVCEAKTVDSVLPSAGIAYALNESLNNDEYQIATVSIESEEVALAQAQAQNTITTKNGSVINYSDLVIAQVNNYVNVRDYPDENTGNIIGKLYNNSVGTLIKEENGWYQITSGNCTGWVKAEYCVTGDVAADLVPVVGTTYANVTTLTLKVRSEPSADSAVIGLVPMDDDYIVLEELDDWVKVSTEDGDGYLSKQYVSLNVEFVYAESKAEEEARIAKEEAARKAAQEAAAKKQAKSSSKSESSTSSSSSSSSSTTYSVSGSGSEYGKQVAQYALQFVGNPYVYGGTSLTKGADCSGFVMSVYANFGVSLPHSSKADRSQGYEVEGGLANAQPGDLVCYSGHVALYIGDGKIVHASTSKTGIIVSNANYKTPITVRRIF